MSDSKYFELQAKATELAQDAEFSRLMAEALSSAAEGARYDVADDLLAQASGWDRKAQDASDKLANLKEATKRCFGFTLHG